MINLFKLFTQSGRKSIVRQILDENVSADIIYDECSKIATTALAKCDIDGDKRTVINDYLIRFADFATAVSKAAEDGTITSDEMKYILDTALRAFKTSLPAVIESVKELVVSKVP